MLTARLAISCLSVILLGTPAKAAPELSNAPENLKDEYQQSKKEASQRLYNCAIAEKQFNEFDIYRSPTSSKTYGVDVRGRIWTLKRDPNRGCMLQSQHRLNKPDYEIDYLGKKTWITFYYEEKQLCLYTQEQSQKTIRRCYQPIGLVNRLAPYFLH